MSYWFKQHYGDGRPWNGQESVIQRMMNYGFIVTRQVLASPPTKKWKIMQANSVCWTEDIFSDL